MGSVRPPERPFSGDSGSTRETARAGRPLDEDDPPWGTGEAPFDLEAELRQRVRGPAGRSRLRRLAHDEVATEPKKGRCALGRHRRRRKAPSDHNVEVAPQLVLATQILGPGVPRLDASRTPQVVNGPSQEVDAPSLRVHEHDLRCWPGQHAQDQAGQATAAAQIGHPVRHGVERAGEGERVVDLLVEGGGAEESPVLCLGKHLLELSSGRRGVHDGPVAGLLRRRRGR